MKQESSSVVKSQSEIAYDYATIKITQSRIDKGLIAIPIGLANWFPSHNDTIQVYLNDSPFSQTKQYSSYLSSTRECRIGGLKEWFGQNNIKSGDEIVIQLFDKEHFVYKLIPEHNFIVKTKELQLDFDKSESEQEAMEKISILSEWIHFDKNKVILNEYFRLVDDLPYEERPYVKKISIRSKENVPTNLRTLLQSIYKGHCQVCDFWFLKRDKDPYFEVHHLDPLKGHHPKNLLVVCGNCHNQFEHSYVRPAFNDDSWLIRVSFNDRTYPIKQVPLTCKHEIAYKELFV